MTLVGIQWAEHLENRRHNMATEGLSAIDTNTRVRAQTLAETKFVNLEMPEAQSRMRLQTAQTESAYASAEASRASAALSRATASLRNAEIELTKAKEKTETAKKEQVVSQTRAVDLENYVTAMTMDTAVEAANTRNNFLSGTSGKIYNAFQTVGTVFGGSVKISLPTKK